jgi:hypothetical protein
MPKLTYSATKGLVQEAGAGIDLATDSVGVGLRRKVITWSADKTLTAADSGAIVFCSQQGTAIDLELPTAANAGSGWFCEVVMVAASTAAATIDFQADTALVFVHLADGGTDSNAATVQTKQSLVLSTSATVGTRVSILSNGTAYYVTAWTGTAAEITVADTGV